MVESSWLALSNGLVESVDARCESLFAKSSEHSGEQFQGLLRNKRWRSPPLSAGPNRLRRPMKQSRMP